MADFLRVGIAGYGLVGQRRRQYIDLHPSLRTVAVCDKNLQQNGKFTDGVRFYANYQDLLQDDLDILFVCLTPDIAPQVTIAGLENNLHVFCEKPPGRTIKDILLVREAEKRNKSLKLKYGFNHRYHDSVKEALKIIQSGKFGTIVNMKGVYGKSGIVGGHDSWRTKRSIAGGGILLDQGIHMIDLMLCFANEPFTEIKSFISNSYWGHDVEDNSFSLMKTNSGIVAMMHSTATQWRHRFSLDVTLQDGGLILSGILSGTKSYGQERLITVYRGKNDGGNPREVITNYIHDNSWRDEIDDFAKAIMDDTPVQVGTSQDALDAIATVYKIYCADDEWQNRFNIHLDL